MKETIFISHANPENNYFASWLASKLRLLGYTVWVDVKNLNAGSSFWNEIELIMRNESIRFISIVSENYIGKSRNRNTGVYSEVTLAKTLSKKIDKYIIPLKLDNSSYDDFPLNILPLDTIDFSHNWGKGLKELTNELEEQEIPRTSVQENVLSQWHEYQKIQGTVIKKDENYASNWFSFSYPKIVFAYKFVGEIKSLYKLIPFSFVRNGDYIIGFFEDNGLDFRHTHSEAILVNDIIENDVIVLENGDKLKDAPQKLISLLNKVIGNYFYGLDNFGAYPASNKKKIFYPKFDETQSGYISLKHFGKRGRKLYSKDKNIRWRFGLSFLFQLKPFPHLIASYHVVSSDENGFLVKDKQLKARRSIPSGWFNRDWYERVLGFLFLASNKSKNLELIIPVGNEDIIINIEPINFSASQSYNEK